MGYGISSNNTYTIKGKANRESDGLSPRMEDDAGAIDDIFVSLALVE